MEKFLYFRVVADVDNDDGTAKGSDTDHPTSLMIPSSKIVSIAPSTDSILLIQFESVRNQPAMRAGATGEEVLTDFVGIEITRHKHKEVADAIIQAINSNQLYTDGFITVFDHVTTNLANEAVEEIKLHPDIIGPAAYTSDADCTAIQIGDAQ